jgi:thioredoxin reductase (NADPH)
MYDMIIVGGGPAACAAAVYALDKQLRILVIAEDVGGKVGLPRSQNGQQALAWKVGEEAARLFEYASVQHHDLVLRSRVVEVEKLGDHFAVTTQQNDVRTSATVLIATGVTPVSVDVPGARQWLGYGLGYSPTTYARALHDKQVVVIGATQRALRGAAELARTAAQVYVMVPNENVAAPALLAHLRECANVSVLVGYRLAEFVGQQHIERVGIARGDETASLGADAVFADLGLIPHTEMVRHIAALDLEGFIVVNAQHETSVTGLFAAGDCTTTFSEQVTVALGDGTRAAISAYDYLLARAPTHARAHGAE